MNGVSKPVHKAPVLTSLKQCVKKIEDEVAELKQSFNVITLEEDESKTSFYLQKSQTIKKEINYLQHDCEKFKLLLNTDIERTKSYFYDMEDLTLDIEGEIGILEKHLRNYGYEPPDLDTSSVQEYETVFDDSCCENEISENNISMTPQFDADVVSVPQNREKEEIAVENEHSTPELDVEAVEPEKKPRHMLPSSPLPFALLGSASKLGDVARRLDF